jgi:hypothetical protein
MLKEPSVRFGLLLIGAVLIIIGIVAYARIKPSTPDDTASRKLGALAVDVLGNPSRVEAFEFCSTSGGCGAATVKYASSMPTPFHQESLTDYKANVPFKSLKALFGELYNGANYEEASGQLYFHPEVGYRFWSATGSFVDVVVCLKSRTVRIQSFSSPTARPCEAWISPDLNPQALAAAAQATFLRK